MTENQHESQETGGRPDTEERAPQGDAKDPKDQADAENGGPAENGQVGSEQEEPGAKKTMMETEEEVADRIRSNLMNNFVNVNKKEPGQETESTEQEDDPEFAIPVPEGNPKDWTDEEFRNALRLKYGEKAADLELIVKSEDPRATVRQKMKARRDRLHEHNNSTIDPEKEIETVEVEVDPLLDETLFIDIIEKSIDKHKKFWTRLIAEREGIFSSLAGLVTEIREDTSMGSPDLPEKLIVQAVNAMTLKEICKELELDESLVLALDPRRNVNDDIASIIRKELHKVLKPDKVR